MRYLIGALLGAIIAIAAYSFVKWHVPYRSEDWDWFGRYNLLCAAGIGGLAAGLFKGKKK